MRDDGRWRATAEDGTLGGGVFWGLLLLLVWAPLPLASNRPWAWSLLALTVGVLLALWSLAALARPGLARLGWRPLMVPGLLFAAALLWFLVQASGLSPARWHAPIWRDAGAALGVVPAGAISVDPSASIGGAMRLLAYGGVFWLAAQYGRDPARARQVLWTVAAAGFAYAVYALSVHLSGSETILWMRKWAYHGDLTGTFVNRNAYGVYAGLGMLATLALLAGLARRGLDSPLGGRARVIHFFDSLAPVFYLLIFAWLTLATALAFSHSRGALVASAAATGLFLLGLGVASRRRWRPVAAAALILALTGLAVVEFSGGFTLGRIVALAEEGTGRSPIHGLVARALAAAPWTGYGLDSFPQVFYAWRDASIPWESPRYDKAHGAYLELVLEAGWPAGAALLAALAWVVATIAAGIVRRRRGAVYPCLGLAATALAGLQAVYDFGVQMPAVAVTYYALLGVAYAQAFPTRAISRAAEG